MTALEPLQAVDALRRCMLSRDYAGAARLVTMQATLEGLTILAEPEPLRQSEAERAYRQSVAEWRAEHEATLRRPIESDLRAVIALLADALYEEEPGAWCRQCTRALTARSWKCRHCGALNARSVGWPAAREAA